MLKEDIQTVGETEENDSDRVRWRQMISVETLKGSTSQKYLTGICDRFVQWRHTGVAC